MVYYESRFQTDKRTGGEAYARAMQRLRASGALRTGQPSDLETTTVNAHPLKRTVHQARIIMGKYFDEIKAV